MRELGFCRFCNKKLVHSFVDLGVTPLCQTHIRPDELDRMEPFYPLHALICDSCLLVQLQEFVAPSEIFEEYAYFSSYSESWLEHARKYSSMAIERFGLKPSNFVVELASNDGYLLRNFTAAGIRCLGIEPAANVAAAARKLEIETVSRFFGVELAEELVASRGKADLIIGNNVLAHVPDLNDFVSGMKHLLAQEGAITMEFPHLQRLMEQVQFDTIYHEHFSYFSFHAVTTIFRHHQLEIFDVEELPTHGGSLRIYAQHSKAGKWKMEGSVAKLLSQERSLQLDRLDGHRNFQTKVEAIKRDLLDFLIRAKNAGKSVVGYGAPGKGNTLLNYCGIGSDLLDYTVDRNPYKQGKFTPGRRIAIREPAEISKTRPDYVLILPWNLKQEIIRSNQYIEEWGGKFVIPIPEVQVLSGR